MTNIQPERWPPTDADLKRFAAEMHEQSVKRLQMKKALRSVITPILRGVGFSGTCPRDRRLKPDRYDLLMFDFNKYHDSFSIQIGQCAPDDIGHIPREQLKDLVVVERMKKIDPEYLRWEQRARIQPGQ